MKKMYVKERIFRCELCNNKQIAYKKANHMTAAGHKKHMWCYKCMDITAHIQQSKWD